MKSCSPLKLIKLVHSETSLVHYTVYMNQKVLVVYFIKYHILRTFSRIKRLI